jgi:hypothetical protein
VFNFSQSFAYTETDLVMTFCRYLDKERWMLAQDHAEQFGIIWFVDRPLYRSVGAFSRR